MDPGGGRFRGGHGCGVSNQTGIPCGGLPQRDRKYSAVAVDDVASVDERDAEPRFLHGRALYRVILIQARHLLFFTARICGCRKHQRAELSGPGQNRQVPDGIHGRRRLVQLTDLFFQGHPREQILNTAIDGLPGVFIEFHIFWHRLVSVSIVIVRNGRALLPRCGPPGK